MIASPQEDCWVAADGSVFGRRRWQPTGQPRARVLALHGLSGRAENFEPLGERLRDRGMALEAWNLRGQGLDPDERRRGAWLDLDGMLADLAHYDRDEGPTPLFLAGESMGALLAIQAAVRPPWRDRLAGLLLFVPVVGLAQKNPAWIKTLLRSLSRILPRARLRPSWFVQGSASAPPLTRIAERQHELETAPHRVGPTTLGFLVAMAGLIEAALPEASRLTVPVAVFSAGRDVFVRPEQTREFFDRIRSREKSLFFYPESYHQMFFDLDADLVLADAEAWIEARLTTTPSR